MRTIFLKLGIVILPIITTWSYMWIASGIFPSPLRDSRRPDEFGLHDPYLVTFLYDSIPAISSVIVLDIMIYMSVRLWKKYIPKIN